MATLRHYQQKALAITRTHNCIIEFVLEAERWARQLDEQFAGREKPLLFGLPFSVKENFAVYLALPMFLRRSLFRSADTRRASRLLSTIAMYARKIAA